MVNEIQRRPDEALPRLRRLAEAQAPGPLAEPARAALQELGEATARSMAQVARAAAGADPTMAAAYLYHALLAFVASLADLERLLG